MRRRFINGSKESFDYSNYMTIEALEDNVLVQLPRNSKYGINGIGWKEYNNPLFLKAGQFLSIKDTVAKGEVYGRISIVGRCNLRGSCMSLIYGDNLNGNNSLLGYDEVLNDLFGSCSYIEEVENNFLPATTLAKQCYIGMFSGCTSLVNAPELPATTLAKQCYIGMFKGCTNLNYIKMLAIDISAENCLNSWVEGVSPTGTFVKSKDATWDVVGDSGVPVDWTVVNAVTMNTNSLIEFTIINTIDSTTTKYQAEEGMTWEEWCELEYNIGRYKVSAGTICINLYVGSLKENNGVTRVKPSNIIQENAIYYYNDSGAEPT